MKQRPVIAIGILLILGAGFALSAFIDRNDKTETMWEEPVYGQWTETPRQWQKPAPLENSNASEESREEKAKASAQRAALVSTGAIFCMVGLGFLTLAGWFFLAPLVSPHEAALIVPINHSSRCDADRVFFMSLLVIPGDFFEYCSLRRIRKCS